MRHDRPLHSALGGREPFVRRLLTAGLALCVLGLLFVAGGAVVQAEPEAPDAEKETPALPGAWSQADIEAASRMPIQHEGRVKPFSTFAHYTLMRFSGYTSYKPEKGDRLSATAVMMDIIFRPSVGAKLPILLVTDSDALVSVGLEEAAKRKRDRYSYVDLQAGLPRLKTKAAEYSLKKADRRTRIENQTIDLARNLGDLERLLFTFQWIVHDVTVPPSLATLFNGKKTVSVVEYMPHAPRGAKIFKEIPRFAEHPDPVETARRRREAEARQDAFFAALSDEDRGHLSMFNECGNVLTPTRMFAWFPPPATQEEESTWISPYDLLFRAQPFRGSTQKYFLTLAILPQQASTPGEEAAFTKRFVDYQESVRQHAEKRGEMDHLDLEVSLFRLKPFFWAKWIFVFAFVVVALSWLVSLGRWLPRLGVALSWIALGFVTTGIVMRCLVLERPPVGTLYETILFITGCTVLAALIAEAINRKGLALPVAALLGAAGMFLAGSYESLKGQDTLAPLEAVLDTNYWLAIHVTTVSIGYCAGLLAAAIAHVYVLGKAFGLRADDPRFYGNVGRMVYGTVCFGMVFSIFGTIAGGIWANDSWGRFWGWDPKENGALMIVLANIAILHARMGGIIKPFGISMAAIATGVIVAFSWWHVNLLQVGLHSYGFTAGIANSLNIFYATEGAVLVTGFYYLWFGRRMEKRAAAAAKSGS